MNISTWLVEIEEAECVRLLDQSTMGRLGVIADGRPLIYPVNHVVDAETATISFPTEGHSALDAALHWPWVAFEVDGTEPTVGSWSVLVVGQAEEITDNEVILRLAERRGRHVHWVTGASVRWLRIRPTSITGRRISAPFRA